MGEPWEHRANCSKPGEKGQILFNFCHLNYINCQIHRDQKEIIDYRCRGERGK